MAKHPAIDKQLRAPRAAAFAGVLFAVILTTSQLLIWISLPANVGAAALDVIRHSKAISIASDLRPFAGIAFLWFIAVIRNRLGHLEDRFFATVFLGSGLLYIAMVFTSAALAGGVIQILSKPPAILGIDNYSLARAQIDQSMNVFGIKMAGVFMISTSTILVRTKIVPRWIAFLGYILAAIMLLSIGVALWISLLFPGWVFLVSTAILLEKPARLAENRDMISKAAD